MRLLASVYSLVDSKSRSLDESFVAFGIVANVGPDSSVNALCEYAPVRKTAHMCSLNSQLVDSP